jgi:hypothetical protein
VVPELGFRVIGAGGWAGATGGSGMTTEFDNMRWCFGGAAGAAYG